MRLRGTRPRGVRDSQRPGRCGRYPAAGRSGRYRGRPPPKRRESQFRAQPTTGDANPRIEALARLDALRSLITGYDVNGGRARVLLAEYERPARRPVRRRPELVEAELGLLTTFADVCELSRNRPTLDEEDTDERVHSPREHFHSYLQSLDVEVGGTARRHSVPGSLARCVNYDVTDLEPQPRAGGGRLPAVPRAAAHGEPGAGRSPHCSSAGCRRRTSPPRLPTPLGEVLDRLIVATQVRYPVIGDIARNLRFRLLRRARRSASAREQVYDGVRGGLQYLAEHPDAADYAARIDALVATPSR